MKTDSIFRRRLALSTMAGVAVALLGGKAVAQTAAGTAAYPAKPITLVVPSAAGGGLDVAMRHVARRLSEVVGFPVIVENRPGVNLLIGTRHVAAAPPDGYTLLAMSNTFIGASIFADAPGYDPFRDFIAVSSVAEGANLLLVNSSSAITSARDLVEQARKAGSNKLSFGSAGIGSSPHVAAQLFARSTGTDYIDVPYKGTAPAMVDLLGGRITFLFDSVASALPHLKAGTLRALAVTTATRSSLMPEVPTIAEAGLRGFEFTAWQGIVVPAGTDKAIIGRIQSDVVKVLAMPDVRHKLVDEGANELVGSTPDALGRLIRTDIQKYRKLYADAGIRIE